jgi:hypothetical protein
MRQAQEFVLRASSLPPEGKEVEKELKSIIKQKRTGHSQTDNSRRSKQTQRQRSRA